MTQTRFPSVPLADDPELGERALWNDEIAEDLARQVEAWNLAALIERAGNLRDGLRDLGALMVQEAAAYRHAMGALHQAGMSYAQIGAALGISRGTVQKHIERAREQP